MAKSGCLVEGCENDSHSRGWCGKHYSRWRIHGDPLLTSRVPRECSVEGCEARSRCKGMCAMHYQRNRRDGNPGPAGRLTEVNSGEQCSGPECDRPAARGGICWGHDSQVKRGRELTPLRPSYGRGMTVEEKLDAFSSPPDERGCRVWMGSVQANGYPTISKNETGARLTHRVAYMLHTGERIDSRTPVHHTCENTRCVEPEHLQAVTPEENGAEMLERRWYKARILDLEAALSEASPNHPLLEGSE